MPASEVPPYTLYDYLARWHTFSQCSDSCYIMAFIYIDRIMKRHPNLVLNKKTIHRLVLGTLVVAIKFHDDLLAKNTIYARLGGVTASELNLLVISILLLLQFKVNIRPQVYYSCLGELSLQCQRIDEEEALAQEEMIDCVDSCGKLQKSVLSTSTIRTIHSMNDMLKF